MERTAPAPSAPTENHPTKTPDPDGGRRGRRHPWGARTPPETCPRADSWGGGTAPTGGTDPHGTSLEADHWGDPPPREIWPHPVRPPKGEVNMGGGVPRAPEALPVCAECESPKSCERCGDWWKDELDTATPSVPLNNF